MKSKGYLFRNYHIRKKSAAQIADDVGVTKDTIIRWIKLYGMPVRNSADALRKKWASGTRKPNPRGYGKKISEKLKILHSQGRLHKLTYEDAMKGLMARDMEKVRAAARLIGKQKIGTRNPPGPSARGPGNMWSIYWVLRTPKGGIIHGWNLAELIRCNHELFDDVDLCPIDEEKHRNGMYTPPKAYRRLCLMFSEGKSWKGWEPIARLYEEPPNNSNFALWKREIK